MRKEGFKYIFLGYYKDGLSQWTFTLKKHLTIIQGRGWGSL